MWKSYEDAQLHRSHAKVRSCMVKVRNCVKARSCVEAVSRCEVVCKSSKIVEFKSYEVTMYKEDLSKKEM